VAFEFNVLTKCQLNTNNFSNVLLLLSCRLVIVTDFSFTVHHFPYEQNTSGKVDSRVTADNSTANQTFDCLLNKTLKSTHLIFNIEAVANAAPEIWRHSG